MGRIRFLGTGSGSPHPERCSSSILVEGPFGGLLLDAGEGCSRRLLEPDSWAQNIRSIVISHNHADHVAGLFMLLNGFKADRRLEPLELLAPLGLREALAAFLPAVRLGEDRLSFELRLRELRSGVTETESGHHLEVWANDHLPSDEEGRGGSYCMAVQQWACRIVYSGDLGSLAPLRGRLKNTALLIAEAMHVEPEETVALALSEGVERTILTHVATTRGTPDILGAEWAHDNLVVKTSRKSP